MTMSADPLPREKPVVLIVDDQTRNIQVVGSTLVAAGYEVLPATSGEQALQRLHAKLPDLILLDILMPKMDGFEVCRQLQENPEFSEIPIIFLSAADEKDVIIRALEAGGVDYITKPFNKAELLLRVRTHVELKEARDRLRELLQMREEFLGILAHDLKNPLTAIRFSAQLMMERSSEVPPQFQKLTASILEGSNHMFEFIDQFLADKARDNVLLSVDLHPIDLVRSTEGVLERHKASAARKQIRLNFTKPDKPIMIQADANALAQVIDNLLSNAIKFSPEGKPVNLEIGMQENTAALIVEDEGPGFTEADKKRIWQRFVRLSAKPTAGETSTGLGLSIVKRLVGMMKGSVDLQSTPGKGATFTVQLRTTEP